MIFIVSVKENILFAEIDCFSVLALLFTQHSAFIGSMLMYSLYSINNAPTLNLDELAVFDNLNSCYHLTKKLKGYV